MVKGVLRDSPIELLAPAGSWESLTAALRAGAGAVYFGVGKLNMRARAAMNFGEEDLAEIVARCHEARVRAYLTLNNIVYDSEQAAIDRVCRLAREAGVDAVICHDPAVIESVVAEGIPVHLSTQANVSNIRAVKFYARFADVIVLARELTLERIRAIAEAIAKEEIRGPCGKRVRLEAFVHGALCVGISGKCQMSLYQTNHSANRGDCLQSCRRRYTVTDAETGDALEIDNEYVLSPKDLCTIGCLDDLLEAGISVLKIEGRGRSADYVATAVACYGEAVAAIEAGAFTESAVEEWRARLTGVFNRGFWEGGYYLGRSGEEWAGWSGNRATVRKKQIGKVSNFFAHPCVAEIKIHNGEVATGDELLIIGPSTGCLAVSLTDFQVEEQVVAKASAGESLTVQVPETVRRNDKVFLLTRA